MALANYVVDVALLVAFLVDYNLRFSGLTVHEWLGIAIGVVLVGHTVLHWDWIVRTVRRLGGTSGRQRLSAALALAVFLDLVLLVVSGVLISRVALPSLARQDRFWRWLHIETAHLATYLVAIHFALSWKWMWALTKRLLGEGGRAPRVAAGEESA